jgi:hypothetical protein
MAEEQIIKNKGGRPKKVVNKGGRPTVFTPAVVDKLEQAFAIDATVEEACSYADISRDAFYDHLKRNPAFSDRIEALRQRPVLAARQTVVKAVSTDSDMAMRYLERKKRNEFSTKQELEHSGEITMSQFLAKLREKKNGNKT